jgi:rhodanese-related sulfurtransferase
MRHFTPRDLKAHIISLEQPPILLDVREPWEYQICHIPGSVLIPMRQIPTAIHDLDPRKEIVVICHHGIRSRQTAMFLEHQGFTDVINLTGGMTAWAHDVDPNTPTY